MSEPGGERALPTVTGLVAGGLVTLGVLLWMFGAKEFLFVAGLGAFGPGILRELGWLRDHDEFQRQSAHRAGYHAYLIGGLVAVVLVSVLEWRGVAAGEATEWLRLIVLVSWLSWMFSSLLAYWGAARTTRRVLMTFGTFWLVFVGATLVGDAATSSLTDMLLGTSVGIGIVAPFFVLAWAAGRWPRASGAILLVVSVVFVAVFGRGAARGIPWSAVLVTQTILVVPLVASGIALLRDRENADDFDGDDEAVAGAAIG